MWLPEGTLVQIEMSPGLAKTATAADNRDWLERMFGTEPPKEGQLLLAATQKLRDDLQCNDGLSLPSVSYRDDERLNANQVIIYFGIEIQTLSVRSLTDVLNAIRKKVYEYSPPPPNRHAIQQVFPLCLEDIDGDRYQDAFEKYKRLYYDSVMGNYEHEAVRCLSDAANIFLRNGRTDHAIALLERASIVCESPMVVDPRIKAQVAITAGNTYKRIGDISNAFQCFARAYQCARDAGLAELLFLVAVNLSELHYRIKDYKNAVLLVNFATSLILSQPSNTDRFRIALELRETIVRIQSEIIKAQERRTAPPASPLFGGLMRSVLMSLVHSVAKGTVFKLLGLNEGMPIVQLWGRTVFSLQHSVFHGPTMIGNDNRQNN